MKLSTFIFVLTLVFTKVAFNGPALFAQEKTESRNLTPAQFQKIRDFGEKIPFVGMSSKAPATKWQEALITGNGTLGAMVFGDPAKERIVLNHERLYEPLLDKPCPVPDLSGSLPEVRKLLLAGKYDEAYEFSWQYAKKQGFPGIQWTDPYHPACALAIEQDTKAAKNYLRTTNFETGEVNVSWTNGQGNRFTRQTFASRPDGIIATRIVGSNENAKGFVSLINQDRRNKSKRTDKFGGGYLDPEIKATEDSIEYRCKYTRSKRGYVVLLKAIAINGEVSMSKRNLEFAGKDFLLLTAIESLEDYATVDQVSAKMRKKLDSVDPDYERLLDSHSKIHGEMFRRVKLDLGGEHTDSETLIAQQAATRDTELNVSLLQKMFNMGRYTLISSSGEWPPNLMGLWNGEWRPKWSGDFTLDANVNLQIASACIGNLPEATESYSRLINGLLPDWRANAKQLYGCNGVMSGSRTSGRDNLHTHFSRGFPGHFWTAGAQWMVLPMFEHYQTTGDEEFLRDQLAEVMTEIARFYVDFLEAKDESGKRMFAPSYSPENKPSNSKSPATINATMDIACARESLSNLLGLAGEQKVELDDELRKKCETILAELPPYLIAKDGALKEWAWEGLDDNNDHRHVSHLYPVWPGHEINPEDTPELFAAAKIAAANRGRGNGSAHGLAHMALIGTRLKDRELVSGNLRFMLANNYILPSLFTYHNPGHIYNADMLHSLPAVVMEMLVYSKPGEIELLPALPDDLPSGSISGVCCRNETVINDLKWHLKKGQADVTVTSRKDQRIKFRLRRRVAGVKVRDRKVQPNADGTFEVDLKKNESTNVMVQFNR